MSMIITACARPQLRLRGIIQTRSDRQWEADSECS